MKDKELLKYIKSFLIRGNNFVLPEIGEFRPSYKSADVDEKKKNVTPPGQTIHFDPGKKQPTGKLAEYIAANTTISKNEATEAITRYAKQIAETLEKEQKYHIEGVGVLRKDENKLVFKQDDKEMLSSSSYGMNSVKFVEETGSQSRPAASQPAPSEKKTGKQPGPTQKQNKQSQVKSNKGNTQKPSQQKAKAAKSQPKAPTTNKTKPWVMPVVIVLIVLVVVAGGGFALIKTGVIGSSQQNASGWISQVRDFKLFGDKSPATEKNKEQGDEDQKKNKAQSDKSAKETSEQEQQAENKKTEKSTTGEEKQQSDQKEKAGDDYQEPERQASSEDSFHLIAGSYQEFDNAYDKAEEFVDQGFDAEVIKSDNGYFRVSIASFSYRSMAIKEMENLRDNKNLETWVLQK